MRILFLTYANLRVPSAEKTHVEELCKSFEKLGHNVELVCKKPPEGKDYAHPFPFVNVPFLSLITKAIEGYTMRKLVKRLSLDCDIIYKRHDINGFFSDLGYGLGLPIVLEVNGSAELEKRFNESREDIIKKVKENDIKSVKKADAIVVVSEGLRDYYIKNGIPKEKIIVVQNGFNPEVFKPMNKTNCRKKLGLENRPTVLFIGDIRPWHGVEYAIKAIGIVKNHIENINLLVVGGDADSNKKLSEMVENLGVKNNVTLIGRVPYKIVPVYINSADICIAPFTKERICSAIKLFEYAACKKPIVTTSISCVKEVFIHMKNTYLVTPESVKEFSNAVIKLLKDDRLSRYISKNAFNLSRIYTWDNSANKIILIFEKITQI